MKYENSDSNSAKADIQLALDAQSGAAANGTEKNKVTATLSIGENLLSGETILFSVNGSAKFDNDQSLISATTSVFGEAVVNMKDKVSETVTVTAVYDRIAVTAESTFGEGGSGGDEDEVTVYLASSDFNLSNICRSYGFTAGKNYKITLPSNISEVTHLAAPYNKYFDPITCIIHSGSANYAGDGPVSGNLFPGPFEMTKSGVFGFFTTRLFYRLEGFPGAGNYTFKFQEL